MQRTERAICFASTHMRRHTFERINWQHTTHLQIPAAEKDWWCVFRGVATFKCVFRAVSQTAHDAWGEISSSCVNKLAHREERIQCSHNKLLQLTELTSLHGDIWSVFYEQLRATYTWWNPNDSSHYRAAVYWFFFPTVMTYWQSES